MKLRLGTIAAALCWAAAPHPVAAQAACDAYAKEVHEAAAAGAFDRISALAGRVQRSGCSGDRLYCLRRVLSDAYVSEAEARWQPGMPFAKVKPMLEQASELALTWRVALRLGEATQGDRSDSGRFDKAAKLYQIAINDIREVEKSELCPGERDGLPGADVAEAIYQRATVASGLASSFSTPPVMRDGEFGGVVIDSFRGFAPKSRPIPITFEYNKTSFTPKGREAADFLLSFLSTKKYPAIYLTGHTDDVGTPAYNCDLSQRRLAAVKDYLVGHGVKADTLYLTPLGEFDPVALDDPSQYSKDQIDNLNRRVELRPEAPPQAGKCK